VENTVKNTEKNTAKRARGSNEGAGQLRIIAGVWRGRMIAAPDGRDVRPTAQRARESLFNRLAHAFGDFTLAGARVVDVCAGSGALGLEALSRGAAAAIFIEQAADALTLLRRNIATLGAEDRAQVLAADARSLPRAVKPCDLALLDPPYGEDLAPPLLAALHGQGWLRPGAVVSVETAADEQFALPGGYTLVDRRATGRAAITLLRAK
jgi:16S rRNA (guanine966-N2)-methyltransferase